MSRPFGSLIGRLQCLRWEGRWWNKFFGGCRLSIWKCRLRWSIYKLHSNLDICLFKLSLLFCSLAFTRCLLHTGRCSFDQHKCLVSSICYLLINHLFIFEFGPFFINIYLVTIFVDLHINFIILRFLLLFGLILLN